MPALLGSGEGVGGGTSDVVGAALSIETDGEGVRNCTLLSGKDTDDAFADFLEKKLNMLWVDSGGNRKNCKWKFKRVFNA